jgi:hypothetical protein
MARTAAPTRTAEPDRRLDSLPSRASSEGPLGLGASAPRLAVAEHDRRHDHRRSTATIVKAVTVAAFMSDNPRWLEPLVRCDRRNSISLLALRHVRADRVGPGCSTEPRRLRHCNISCSDANLSPRGASGSVPRDVLPAPRKADLLRLSPRRRSPACSRRGARAPRQNPCRVPTARGRSPRRRPASRPRTRRSCRSSGLRGARRRGSRAR